METIHRHVNHRRESAIKAVDAGTATFSQWFETQFGGAPSPETLTDLRRQLHDAEVGVSALRLTVEAVATWQDRRDAALKAWQAREDLIRRNLAAQASG